MACCKAEEYDGWCKELPPEHQNFYKDEEGRSYCVFHAPQWEKGKSLDEFNHLVFERIESFKGKDETCFFDGTVFKRDISFSRYKKSNPLPEISFISSKFNGNASFNEVAFSGYAEFNGAQFNGSASFKSAQFSKDAEFNGAQFSGSASFWLAKISGNADFSGAKISGNVDFSGAKISGETYFSGAKISGIADFRGALFSGSVVFDRVKFSGDTNFSSAKFISKANFNYVNFEKTSFFKNAKFKNMASFIDTTFGGDVDFTSSSFELTVGFLSSKFNGNAIFNSASLKDASFEHAIFNANAYFTTSHFSEEASFESCIFKGYASFKSTMFSGFVAFARATFEKNASFSSSTFKDADFSSVSFSRKAEFFSTTFELKADFSNTNLHTTIFLEETFNDEAIFDNVSIENKLRFLNVNLRKSSFEGTDFRDCDFQNIDWPERNSRYILKEEELLIAEENQFFKSKVFCKLTQCYYRVFKSYNMNEIKEVESKYRALKKKAEEHGDMFAYSKWHFSEKEMLWKRTRLDKPGYFIVLNLYRISSGFGEEPWRAGRWLLYLFIIASFIFALTGLAPVKKELEVKSEKAKVAFQQQVSEPLVERLELKSLIYTKEGDLTKDKVWDLYIATAEFLGFKSNPSFKPDTRCGKTVKIVFQVIFYIQLSLFIFALRNRFRR